MPGKRGRPPKKTIPEKITNALNIAEDEVSSLVPAIRNPEIIETNPLKISKDVINDYEYAHKNLHKLLEKGNKLLEGITDLAMDSDHPRTYEVAGNLLKTLFEGTRELMTLQKDVRDVEKKTIGENTQQNGNTTVNVEHVDNLNHLECTTMEILELLSLKKQKKLEDEQNKKELEQ